MEEGNYFTMLKENSLQKLAEDLGLEVRNKEYLYLTTGEVFVTHVWESKLFINRFFFGLDKRKFPTINKKVEELDYVKKFNPMKKGDAA